MVTRTHAAGQPQGRIAAHAHDVDDADGQDVARRVELREVGDAPGVLPGARPRTVERTAGRRESPTSVRMSVDLPEPLVPTRASEPPAGRRGRCPDDDIPGVADGEATSLDGTPARPELGVFDAGRGRERRRRAHESVSPAASVVVTWPFDARRVLKARTTKKVDTATRTMVALAAKSNQYEMSKPT